MGKSTRATPVSKRQSHAEKKAATRRDVIHAALDIFSRDGYAKASLDAIADHAGYSKGAIYSNFSGKADLFLAAIDANIDGLTLEDGDIEGQIGRDPMQVSDADITAYAKDATEGFGLAALEFMTVAMRDPELRSALNARIQRLIAQLSTLVETNQGDDDPLSGDEVANLVAAFDLGMDVLQLLGIPGANLGLADVGRQRLMNPVRAAGLRVDPSADAQSLRHTAELEALLRSRLGR